MHLNMFFNLDKACHNTVGSWLGLRALKCSVFLQRVVTWGDLAHENEPLFLPTPAFPASSMALSELCGPSALP